jgi:D-galactarolactone cycloisomerase
MTDHKILDVIAIPTSFPVKDGVTLGVGRTVKRDAVIVKVTTESGLVGYGESHHGRAPSTIAHLVNHVLKRLVVGMDATDTTGIWSKIYKAQLASHGMGAATCLAVSGLDMACWDIKGKAIGWPLYKLLGGSQHAIPAYAGGVSLGYQEPALLIDEARPHIEAGYKALKLRVGDTPKNDLARVAAIRKAFGNDVEILTDVNVAYNLSQVRAIMPGFVENRVGWLEEPFAPHDYRSYQEAKLLNGIPLAAGENHYTRFEFSRVIEDGAITILQPDLSKTGGITEALRIAALASTWKLAVHPHTSMTGLNMAASIHFLAAIDNGGYFEADVSKNNLFRDELVSTPYQLSKDGTVLPLDKPGIGLEVDEEFLSKHPVIEGPAYI